MTEEYLDGKLKDFVDRINYKNQQRILESQRAVEMSGSGIYSRMLHDLRVSSLESDEEDFAGHDVEDDEFDIEAVPYERFDDLNPNLPVVQGMGRPSYRVVDGRTIEGYPIYMIIDRVHMRDRKNIRNNPKSNPNHNSTRQRIEHRKARKDIAKLLN